MNVITSCFEQPAVPSAIDRETSIATIAERLSAFARRPPLAFTGKSRPGDPLRWRGDCPELRALGWQPAVPLDDGLRLTVDWFTSANAI